MAWKVFKYLVPFPAGPVAMPRGAKLLTAKWQNSAFGHGPHVWALIHENAIMAERKLTCVATGQAIPDDVAENADAVATMEFPDGTIWHLFDGGEK